MNYFSVHRNSVLNTIKYLVIFLKIYGMIYELKEKIPIYKLLY